MRGGGEGAPPEGGGGGDRRGSDKGESHGGGGEFDGAAVTGGRCGCDWREDGWGVGGFGEKGEQEAQTGEGMTAGGSVRRGKEDDLLFNPISSQPHVPAAT